MALRRSPVRSRHAPPTKTLNATAESGLWRFRASRSTPPTVSVATKRAREGVLRVLQLRDHRPRALRLRVGVLLDHAERPPAPQRLDGEHVLRLARRDSGGRVPRVMVGRDALLRDVRLLHRVGERLADVDLAEDGYVAFEGASDGDLLLERLRRLGVQRDLLDLAALAVLGRDTEQLCLRVDPCGRD